MPSATADTTTSPRTDAIERVHAPSRQEFEERFVHARRPCVLTGVADQWPAFTRWTAEHFQQVAGDREVTVHYDEHGNFRDWYATPFERRPDRRMKLGEFVDVLTREPPDRRFYMTEHALADISPELVGDLDMSRYISDKLVPEVSSGPCLFLGRDTCMPLHYHATTQAFMCQLRQEKDITLYGPEDFRALYPRRWYQSAFVFSTIDGETQRGIARHGHRPQDLERYPRLARTRPIRFRVHPGEVLFIPVHWWHLTTASGFQVSVTYFWRDPAAPLHYPSPGLQVLAHDSAKKVRNRLRRLGARLRGRHGDSGSKPARLGAYD